jgi:hypothetical protein
MRNTMEEPDVRGADVGEGSTSEADDGKADVVGPP